MNGPRDQFLADPGITGDQDRGIGLGHLLDLGQHPLNGLTFTDNLLKIQALNMLFLVILLFLVQLTVEAPNLAVGQRIVQGDGGDGGEKSQKLQMRHLEGAGKQPVVVIEHPDDLVAKNHRHTDSGTNAFIGEKAVFIPGVAFHDSALPVCRHFLNQLHRRDEIGVVDMGGGQVFGTANPQSGGTAFPVDEKNRPAFGAGQAVDRRDDVLHQVLVVTNGGDFPCQL